MQFLPENKSVSSDAAHFKCCTLKRQFICALENQNIIVVYEGDDEKREREMS